MSAADYAARITVCSVFEVAAGEDVEQLLRDFLAELERTQIDVRRFRWFPREVLGEVVARVAACEEQRCQGARDLHEDLDDALHGAQNLQRCLSEARALLATERAQRARLAHDLLATVGTATVRAHTPTATGGGCSCGGWDGVTSTFADHQALQLSEAGARLARTAGAAERAAGAGRG